LSNLQERYVKGLASGAPNQMLKTTEEASEHVPQFVNIKTAQQVAI